MVPDPWAVLAETDLALLANVDMPEAGRYYHRQRVIFLRRGLLLVEQRVTLWHELVHARRGDTGCGRGWFSVKEEASVDREAAGWAMPFPALLEAMRGDPTPAEAADMLKTTPVMLELRLNTMHPAERAQVRRHLGEREWAA
jgi:hypothetical protein